MVKVTDFVSPGCNETFLNAFNSFAGRGNEDFKSLINNCTISAPSRLPVFVTSTEKVSLPPGSSLFYQQILSHT